MNRKFINTVGCILAVIIFVGGCIVALFGEKVYEKTLAGKPEYDFHMTYPDFVDSIEWGDVEHTSEDSMHAYEIYLHENLSEAGKEAEKAKDPYWKGAICCFVVTGVILVAVLVVNVADEAIKYNLSGAYRQIRKRR